MKLLRRWGGDPGERRGKHIVRKRSSNAHEVIRRLDIVIEKGKEGVCEREKERVI